MATEPVTILICALGGEGGGLLAQWITRAATAEGMTVSATSVPGVAQRTGATSYYLELQPAGAPAQVLGLHPVPGRIDIVIASELVEAGRAMLRGFVTKDRTQLIASTHRVFTISERSAPDDGRVDAGKVRSAASTLARETLLFDAEALARAEGSRTNAVLLGALAGSGGVPIRAAAFEAVLQADRATAAANVAGFRAGLAARPEDQAAAAATAPVPPPQSLAALLQALPEGARETATHGVARLVDYQGARHARTYLERLNGLASFDRDGVLTQVAAKPLALLMSQEDVIRVAGLKSAPERLAQVRRELGAAPAEPCRIYEFLKPGLAEAVGLLPSAVGGPLMARMAGSTRLSGVAWPIRIETTAPWGYLLLRLLAALKPLRPFSYLHADREALIERWLDLTQQAARRSPALAHEVIDTATLIKGYASTLDRTRAAFLRVLDEVVKPAIDGLLDDAHMADAVLQARLAARRDDGGRALSALIAALPMKTRGIAA